MFVCASSVSKKPVFCSYVEISLCNTGRIYIKKKGRNRGMCSGNVRCRQHFLSAVLSAALVGYNGAKHDKSMTAAGVTAERGAEVPAVPDVNTNLEKWDKRRGKEGERVKPKHPGG